METTIKNKSIEIDLYQSATDQAWTVSEGIASHEGCFGGTIIAPFTVVAGKTFVLEYEIAEGIAGLVTPTVAGQAGTTQISSGIIVQNFVIPANATDLSVKFYAEGIVSLKRVSTYPVSADNAVTLGFNAKENVWTTNYSFQPEMMLKYMNDFFSFKNGRLWQHNKNAVRNNFYGIQYPSTISFYVNLSPETIKTFFSMRQKSNKAWSVPEIKIRARDGKPNGQLSRLKKGRFQNLQGDWFADYLKDMNDPRFASQLEALLKGADLQGGVMKVTIENNDTVEVRLQSIDTTVSLQNYSY